MTRLECDTRLPEDVCVRLQDVVITYRLPVEGSKSLKHHVIRWLKRDLRYEDFTALKGINLTVNRSEVFGIVGANGAGKSTLLKCISRVLRPTSGRVQVRGQVAPLLGLGAGFHDDLTGVENVFLNGLILGLTRDQLAEKMEEIEEFAEIGDFINSPLRVYSQGMRARLAFSVASAVSPDILVLDEVLAVGDEAFREKCMEKIREFCQGDMTVIIASHAMGMMRKLCDRVAWIHEGEIQRVGEAQPVIDGYLAFLKERRAKRELQKRA